MVDAGYSRREKERNEEGSEFEFLSFGVGPGIWGHLPLMLTASQSPFQENNNPIGSETNCSRCSEVLLLF